MDALTVARADPADAAALLAAHDAFSAAHSPETSRHNLDAEGLSAPGLRFWVARLGARAVGCGATVPLGDGTEEVKAMHAAAEMRGRGVGAALLDAIVADARARGVRLLSLETGSMAAYAPARRLYARHGFVACPPFGDYGPDPLSTFMQRSL